MDQDDHINGSDYAKILDELWVDLDFQDDPCKHCTRGRDAVHIVSHKQTVMITLLEKIGFTHVVIKLNVE